MKSIIAAIAALAVAVVSAQTTTPVSITSPLQGSSYKAGGQATITWINPTTATLAQVQLVQGPATALQPVAQVATNVNTADGKLTWTVPANTPAGSDYAFELGSSPNIAYSGFFSITAGDGTTASNSSASGAASGSAAASSAPAASGAASSGSAAGSSAPAASGAASSGSASSGSASGSSASGSASPAASSSSTSGASSVKAGLVGAGLAAGAAALLF